MTNPVHFDIDLSSGRYNFEQRSSPLNSNGPVSTDGVLAKATVLGLRRLAQAALADGMQTPACQRAGSGAHDMPPTSDAIVSLSVKLNGTFAATPARSNCWSATADALLSAARKAVEPPPPPEPAAGR